MSTESALLEILHTRGVTVTDIDPVTPLGGDGLGLDSIALAEVLLDCEERFGVSVVELMSGDAITFGDLVERLEQR